MPGKKKFISKIGLKKGALSRQLGIPKKFPSGEKIPIKLQNQLKKELKKIRKKGR